VKLGTVIELDPLKYLTLKAFTVLGGEIIIVSIEVKHENTDSINVVVATILPLLLITVPVTVTVYVPAIVGLVQDIIFVVELKAINAML